MVDLINGEFNPVYVDMSEEELIHDMEMALPRVSVTIDADFFPATSDPEDRLRLMRMYVAAATPNATFDCKALTLEGK